jgi:hypothetical protein
MEYQAESDGQLIVVMLISYFKSTLWCQRPCWTAWQGDASGLSSPQVKNLSHIHLLIIILRKKDVHSWLHHQSQFQGTTFGTSIQSLIVSQGCIRWEQLIYGLRSMRWDSCRLTHLHDREISLKSKKTANLDEQVHPSYLG